MIDHTGIQVSNIALSKVFYETILHCLGYKICLDFGHAIGFGTPISCDTENADDRDPGGDFWISVGTPHTPRTHIAFRAATHDEVNAFYQAALQHGATCNGSPGYRAQYHLNYYAAFVLDPDGYNIEAVCHKVPELTEKKRVP